MAGQGERAGPLGPGWRPWPPAGLALGHQQQRAATSLCDRSPRQWMARCAAIPRSRGEQLRQHLEPGPLGKASAGGLIVRDGQCGTSPCPLASHHEPSGAYAESASSGPASIRCKHPAGTGPAATGPESARSMADLLGCRGRG